MSTRRLGVAVAVLGGFLYAVGGSDGTSPLNTGQSLPVVSPCPWEILLGPDTEQETVGLFAASYSLVSGARVMIEQDLRTKTKMQTNQKGLPLVKMSCRGSGKAGFSLQSLLSG